MLIDILKAITNANGLVVLGGLVLLGIGLSSPPAISPLPGTHPYFRAIGTLLLSVGITLQLSSRPILRGRQWIVLAAGIVSSGLVALLPITRSDYPSAADSSGTRFDLTGILTAMDTANRRIDGLENRIDSLATQVSSSETFPLAPEDSTPEPTQEVKETPAPPQGMVRIRAGSFLMGTDILGSQRAPYPQHYAYVDEFWIQIHEVTNREYEACVSSGVCTPPLKTSSATRPQYFLNDQFAEYPVIWVSYDQAAEFCEWIGGNLPTEDHWERAARGTEGFPYPWGNDQPQAGLSNLGIVGGQLDTAKVGSFPKDMSPDRVFDLAGNVSEWTISWYVAYEGNQNRFDNTGSLRVVRGGNFRSDPDTNYPRSYFRNALEPDEEAVTVGFRCVWTAQIEQ